MLVNLVVTLTNQLNILRSDHFSYVFEFGDREVFRCFSRGMHNLLTNIYIYDQFSKDQTSHELYAVMQGVPKVGILTFVDLIFLQAIPGVPKITEGYNPATWVLEVSSPLSEARLNMNFAEIYANSVLYR